MNLRKMNTSTVNNNLSDLNSLQEVFNTSSIHQYLASTKSQSFTWQAIDSIQVNTIIVHPEVVIYAK